MNIAIQTSALYSQHKKRGIGTYTSLLFESLQKYNTKHQIIKLDSNTNLDHIDLIHYTYIDFFQNTLNIKPTLKTVITIHDVIPLKFPDHFPVGIRGSINWFLQKRKIKMAHGIITDSEASKKDINNLLTIPAERIYRVYLAAQNIYKKASDPKKTAEILTKYGIGQKFILYVGDVNWNKNILGLVDAFSVVHKKIPDVQLVLVGQSFLDSKLPEIQEIDNKIKELEVQKYVLKTGFIPEDELVYLYNSTTLYVQPSFYEGFGLPVLEAMSCGAAVAISNVSSLPEIVGEAGLYFNPHNQANMASIILKGITLSLSEREKIQNNSIKRAALFSQRKFAERTIQVYESIFN